MNCPKCGTKYAAIMVYGYCEDENGNEYPFDPRVYETGGSLPALLAKGEWPNTKWPTRFCYKCRTNFDYQPEKIAFGFSYEDAIMEANVELIEGVCDEK